MILCGGDALIDFVPHKTTDGQEAYVPTVGGSCLNVAITLARLDADVAFIGGASNDLFGEMIVDKMQGNGVKTHLLKRSDCDTTLAFVKMDGADARYAFYDQKTATRQWDYHSEDVVEEPVQALHIGSVTLINEPSASAYERLVADMKDVAIVSFDPNCRPTLINRFTEYKARIERIARMSHIVRFSEEDFIYLYPDTQELDVVSGLFSNGVRVVLISRGPKGASAYWSGGRKDIPACEIPVVDTIGAGDTFHGAFLYALDQAGLLDQVSLRTLTGDQLQNALSFATQAAAFNCTRAGSNPPTSRELAEKDTVL